MAVVTFSDQMVTGGRGASTAPRLSFTWKGMSRTAPLARSMRLILPPAQKTSVRESGVQPIFG